MYEAAFINKRGDFVKIKNRLLLTHGILVALALVIVFMNVYAYKSMEDDADIINQMGRMRMLSYNMAQISNQIILQNNQISKNNLASKLEMRIDEFDAILTFLSVSNMDSNDYLNFSVKLETISDEWRVLYKPAYLNVANNISKDKLSGKINEEIDAFVNDINEMVSSYSIYSRDKISRALMINGSLVLVIIVVSSYSFISTYKGIRKPLKILMRELKALSLIDDKFSKRLKNIGTDEISEMSEYFNEMLYDPLTKTFNRRAGLSKLSRMVQYENRRQLRLSLCFIDINGLKLVNDQLGHQLGDELIISTVDGIKDEIREDDFIIRMGGDEFLVIYKDIDSETAEKVWDRIKGRYDQINKEENRKYRISVSHGIVDYGDDEISEVELLIKSADDKMYAEKKYIKEELNIQIIKSEGRSI